MFIHGLSVINNKIIFTKKYSDTTEIIEPDKMLHIIININKIKEKKNHNTILFVVTLFPIRKYCGHRL